jgi:hypothetical protein
MSAHLQPINHLVGTRPYSNHGCQAHVLCSTPPIEAPLQQSFFRKKKSEAADRIISLIQELKLKNKRKVKFIRCHDGGENIAICKEKALNVLFGYTGSGTPQRNSRVERKLATLYGRIRASYYHASIRDELRIGTWTECANYHQDTDNILVSENKTISSHRQFYERDPGYAKQLKTFGEVGMVAYYGNKAMRSKMTPRGIFVGYSKNHSYDVYRMLDLNTHGLLTTRDILWLNQTYGEHRR